MKTIKMLLVFLGLAAFACAQPSSPSFGFFQGTAPVASSTHPCFDAVNVGSIYTQLANPSITSQCQQIGATPGAQAYAWETIAIGNYTLPTTPGGGTVVIACAATTGATANCADTNVGTTSIVYFGKATLTSGSQVITIAPGYTSTSTYYCVASDTTTTTNGIKAVPTSATSLTLTGTGSDVIFYICVGY